MEVPVNQHVEQNWPTNGYKTILTFLKLGERREVCPHENKKDIFDMISPYKEKRTIIGRPLVLHLLK